MTFLNIDIENYFKLMRFDRPIGTLLLLWHTLWALWIAGKGQPDPFIVMIFILGVIVMRAAGCVVNDLADRNLDGFVSRTKNRPLAKGDVPIKHAIILFVLLATIALLLVLQLNRLCLLIASFGIALTIIYPFTKRIIYLPQVVLGATWGTSVLMAFAAISNNLPIIALWLYASVIFWTVSYDSMYAMVDRSDDINIGIKSTAVLFGDASQGFILVCQILTLCCLLAISFQEHFTPIFYAGFIVMLVLFVYQQYLIKDGEPQACFKAFLNNNWVGFFMFIGILMGIK